jgi:hypothetical protein
MVFPLRIQKIMGWKLGSEMNICIDFIFYCYVCLIFLLLCTFRSQYSVFVCKSVLYYCHRVSTQLQLNIYIYINAIYVQYNLEFALERAIWQPTEPAKDKSSCLPFTIVATWDLERSMADGTVTRPGDGQVAEKYALCRQERHKCRSRWKGEGSTQPIPSVEVHWKPLRRPRNATFKFKLQRLFLTGETAQL